MSENGQQLPPGWIFAKLSDISAILMGQSPPSSTYNTERKGLPFFQGKAEFGALYPEVKVWCSRPGKIAEAGAVLLSVRAPVGPTNLAPSICCIGRGLAAICPEQGLNLKYLLHAFRRFAEELDARGTGTTFKAVSGKVVREFTVPIAPSAEQTRIADALDEILSDLDAGVEALKRTREKLKLYRASVLKAAMEGALSAEWRAQHSNTETASGLLKRILIERRRRWEEEQLRKFTKKGQDPPNNWKAKYKEPVAPYTADLPPLPEDWCWINLDTVIVAGPQNGAYFPGTFYGRGCPILRIDDFQNGWVRPVEELSKVDADAATTAVYALHEGDIVINRVNSLTHLGKCLVVDHSLADSLYESNMMRAELATSIRAKYVEIYLHSVLGRTLITQGAKWAVNQASINQQDVKRTPLPLPSRDEQEAIIEAVEDQLSVIDHLEADIDAKLKNAQALWQSILRQAFTGQLVPQDPNDEPASELLKRIVAEREQRTRDAAAAERTTKTAKRVRTIGRRPRRPADGRRKKQ